MLPRVNFVRTGSIDYLVFGTRDLISRAITAKGSICEFEIAVARHFATGIENPVFVDIGANLGGYTVPIAKESMSSGGVVYAFEPQRIVYYQLCGNVFLNRLDNVFAERLAIGSECKTLEVEMSNYHTEENIGTFSFSEFGEHSRKNSTVGEPVIVEKIKMVTLDSLSFEKNISVVKIDVENLEYEVLMGAQETLRTHDYPGLILELWSADKHEDKESKARLEAYAREIFGFLNAHGYKYDVYAQTVVAQHREKRPYLKFV